MQIDMHHPESAKVKVFDNFVTIEIEDDYEGSLSFFLDATDGDFLVELAEAVKIVTGVVIHGEAHPTE